MRQGTGQRVALPLGLIGTDTVPVNQPVQCPHQRTAGDFDVGHVQLPLCHTRAQHLAVEVFVVVAQGNQLAQHGALCLCGGAAQIDLYAQADTALIGQRIHHHPRMGMGHQFELADVGSIQ